MSLSHQAPSAGVAAAASGKEFHPVKPVAARGCVAQVGDLGYTFGHGKRGKGSARMAAPLGDTARAVPAFVKRQG